MEVRKIPAPAISRRPTSAQRHANDMKQERYIGETCCPASFMIEAPFEGVSRLFEFEQNEPGMGHVAETIVWKENHGLGMKVV